MAQTCYRHPDRETGVSCSSCGRPICPDCMTPTPVGMRCPECARQRTKVVRGPSGGSATGFWQSPATYVLIAINVVAFLAEVATGSGGLGEASGSLYRNFSLLGVGVSDGEWYRIVTGGFLHAGAFHLLLNMAALFIVGRVLEPGIGTSRFIALYAASLLAGAFGALALTSPLQDTVGASGAVFGIFGATAVIARGRGMNAIASEIGFLIAINLLITFTVPGISIGGHLGGLVGGAICAAAIVAGERGTLGSNHRFAEYAVMAAVAIVSVVGALAFA
jgi:membrane associated rhomboid family serine protease